MAGQRKKVKGKKGLKGKRLRGAIKKKYSSFKTQENLPVTNFQSSALASNTQKFEKISGNIKGDINEENVCMICGGETYDVHCKRICKNCGYMRDCSDP